MLLVYGFRYVLTTSKDLPILYFYSYSVRVWSCMGVVLRPMQDLLVSEWNLQIWTCVFAAAKGRESAPKGLRRV